MLLLLLLPLLPSSSRFFINPSTQGFLLYPQFAAPCPNHREATDLSQMSIGMLKQKGIAVWGDLLLLFLLVLLLLLFLLFLLLISLLALFLLLLLLLLPSRCCFFLITPRLKLFLLIPRELRTCFLEPFPSRGLHLYDYEFGHFYDYECGYSYD